MRNLAALSSDESAILVLCTPTQFALPCDRRFRDGLKRTVGWALSPWALSPPFPYSFLFALHLEWSLKTSVDKKSNAVCIFENLCSILVSMWFKLSIFFSLISFSVKIHKSGEKS